MLSGSRRRILVIHNPTAGRRRQDRLRAVLEGLAVSGCALTIRTTTGPGDASRLAALAGSAEFDVVAVAGGDGTVNEVLNGLATPAPALGLIPAGTANVLAAEIGLDPSPSALVATLAEGEIRPVHMGLANGRRFAMMAGAGFDARVVAGVDVGLKRWAGKGAYVVSAALALGNFSRTRPSYRVEIDDRVMEAASVVIAKGRHYGGRHVMAPTARLADPWFQVCLLLEPGPLALLRYAAALFRGTLAGRPDVWIVPATRVTVRGPEGDPVQLDGDPAGTLPLVATIAPEPLKLVFPASEGAPGPAISGARRTHPQVGARTPKAASAQAQSQTAQWSDPSGWGL